MDGSSKCEKWRTHSHLQQFTIFSDYRHRRSHVMAIKFSSPCLSYLDVYIKVEYGERTGRKTIKYPTQQARARNYS